MNTYTCSSCGVSVNVDGPIEDTSQIKVCDCLAPITVEMGATLVSVNSTEVEACLDSST